MKLLKWLDDYLEEALLLIMLGIMVVVMGIQIHCKICICIVPFLGQRK